MRDTSPAEEYTVILSREHILPVPGLYKNMDKKCNNAKRAGYAKGKRRVVYAYSYSTTRYVPVYIASLCCMVAPKRKHHLAHSFLHRVQYFSLDIYYDRYTSSSDDCCRYVCVADVWRTTAATELYCYIV